MPIGAMVANRHLMQTFAQNPILGHITTFGGHPVSCAAALASLQVIQENGYAQVAQAKGQLFYEELKDHPGVKEIRFQGLMMAVELDTFAQVKAAIDYALPRGLFTDWFLFNSQSLRIAPPLIIEDEDIRWACECLREAIDHAYAQHPS